MEPSGIMELLDQAHEEILTGIGIISLLESVKIYMGVPSRAVATQLSAG